MSTEARHSSESNEFYTPPEIVEPFRTVLGGFDLDPASCELANTIVRATTFYSLDLSDLTTNGLSPSRPWAGNVILNPPGGLVDRDGRPVFVATKKRKSCSETGACGLPPGHKHEGVTSSAKAFWRRAAREYATGNVRQVAFVGFSVEVMQSAQSGAGEDEITPLHAPFCLPEKRVSYLVPDADGELAPMRGNTHSSVLVYLPDRDHYDRSLRRFADAMSSLGRCAQPLM